MVRFLFSFRDYLKSGRSFKTHLEDLDRLIGEWNLSSEKFSHMDFVKTKILLYLVSKKAERDFHDNHLALLLFFSRQKDKNERILD